MYAQLIEIAQFMVEAFIKVWPFLLITIPLSVAVKLSGASKYISRALSAQPMVAIVLATLVGAFSPFCSCGVIPVVASLLIGGVPLAPVMAFWVASPSMDPEIFFLSVSVLGWQLALWRLASTLVLSLSAGFITYFIMQRGWLGRSVLRTGFSANNPKGTWTVIQRGWQRLSRQVETSAAYLANRGSMVAADASVAGLSSCGCNAETALATVQTAPVVVDDGILLGGIVNAGAISGCTGQSAVAGNSCQVEPPFHRRLLQETWAATTMVAKFMALAFFLEALITIYVPQTWIVGLLGNSQPFVIVLAALLGVPIYTSNMAAMPLVGGLLAQGMDPAAALAFLIAGPTTTLPAMAAVWGLTTRRVFALYVGFAFFRAIVAGYAFKFVTAFMG